MSFDPAICTCSMIALAQTGHRTDCPYSTGAPPWYAELEDAVPDACPHGYGPVIVNRVDVGLPDFEVLAAMSYRCPDHCPHSA
jgi:hypothetical protein